MSFKERRQKHKVEFKTEILEAAQSLFSEEGYANFSMRKLAARIEHSPTTIYLYFRDKDDLLFHICEDFYASMLQDILEIRKKAETPAHSLKEILWVYIRYSLAHPEQYKVVFFSNPQLYGRPEDYILRDTMSLRCWTNICQVIDNCMKSGFLRKMDTNMLSIVFWSAIHGLVSSLIFTKDFPMPAPDIMAETLIDGLFKGFRT